MKKMKKHISVLLTVLLLMTGVIPAGVYGTENTVPSSSQAETAESAADSTSDTAGSDSTGNTEQNNVSDETTLQTDTNKASSKTKSVSRSGDAQTVSDEEAGYKFEVTSNLDWADSEGSTTNPYVYLWSGSRTNVLPIETTVIESSKVYNIQINNSLKLENYELSKITINDQDITIPEANDKKVTYYNLGTINGIKNGSFNDASIRIANTYNLKEKDGLWLQFRKTTPTQNIKIHFEFKSTGYKPTVKADDSARGEVSYAATENKNEYTLTATPKEGYRFDHWSVDGKYVSGVSPYTTTLTEDTEFTANFVSEQEGYKFYVTSNLDWAESADSTTNPYFILKKSGKAQNVEETVIESTGKYGVQIQNSLDLDDYELSKITINGKNIEIPEASTTNNLISLGQIEGIANGNGEQSIRIRNWDATSPKSNRGIYISFNEITPTQNIEIHFDFQKKQGPAFNATVTSEDTAKGTIAKDAVQFIRNSEDRTSTKWKLTASPAANYKLSYIQAGTDESTRVDSEDGMTVTWEINENRDYTAYFEKANITFGDYFGYTLGNRSNISSGSKNLQTKALYEGQRAAFGFAISYPSLTPDDSKITYKLYAGENADDDKLLGTYHFSFSSSGKGTTYYPQLVLSSMPDISKLTITAQLNNNDIISRTYDVKVLPSEKLGLSYISSEYNSSLQPRDKTSIGGPDVHDVCAFTDETTGRLTMYFAVSGGVMKYDPAGEPALKYMEGMSFKYNDNFQFSGYPIAIGGTSEDKLAAFVKTNTKVESGCLDYCIYTCRDGVWSKVEGSEFNADMSAYRIGVVLGADDAWTSDRHWDGTSWQDNEIKFNSFWKKDSSTVYAGSADGIYKYDGSKWQRIERTSETTYISGGCTGSSGSVIMITSESSTVSRGIYQNIDLGTSVNKVTISADGSVAAETIDVTKLKENYADPSNIKVNISIDSSGEIYAITSGYEYAIGSSFNSYSSSLVYKYVNGSWVYQIVDEFNDESDVKAIEEGKILGTSYSSGEFTEGDANVDNNPVAFKSRPDGVRNILNILDNLSLLVGKAGAIYGSFGDVTITFDSQGGSEVEPVTQAACSKVTAPESPTYDDYTFGGWYTHANCLSKNLYTFDYMPAKDITLYAKWVEDGDALQDIRAAALSSLEKAYTSYQQSEYDDAAWKELENTYKNGKTDIENAGTYDLIQASLNSAVAAMAAIEKSGEITVTVSVEKFSVDGTYIIEPTEVTVPKYSQASVVVTDLLKEYYKDAGYIEKGNDGKPYRMTGTEINGFYLASVYDPTYKTDEEKGHAQNYKGFLSEFDCGTYSGWMYCVNGSFPGVGASAYTLNNGDVMRWQYTCEGLGADIGADNSDWGSSESAAVADKDALTARIAEINKDKAAFFAQTPDGSNEAAYENAMKVLANIASTQEEVDNALKALGGKVATAEEKLAKARASAKAELNGYDTELYRDAEKTLLVQYRQEGIAAIEAATTVDEVNKALKDAKSKIEALTTAAEYEAMESVADADTTKIYEQTGKYLNGLGTPGVGSTGGEWLTIGLSRADYDVSDEWSEGYYANAVDYVKKEIDKDTGRLHRVKSTDNSRLILALTATGRDVTDVGGYNLLTALADLDYLQKQGNNGPIWALIALDSHDYEIPEVQTEGTQATRENIIDTILKGRNSDGGWSLNKTESGSSDVDMTAMAIQALAPYYKDESHSKHAEVKAAVDKALALLSDMQKKTGGFDSWGTVNAESCAQVLTALTSLGINPEKDERFIKGDYSVIDALLSFAVDDKGFQHVAGGGLDGMATEQAYYALASYYRLLDGKTSLYDMSDVKIGEAYEPDVPVDKPDDSRQDDGKTDNTGSASDKAASTKTAGGKTKSATKSANVKLSGNLTDAAQKVIDKIDALVANGASEDQISDILAAYKAYSELSAEEQLAVEKSDNFKAYSELCTKMGKEYHYDKATGTDMRDNSEEVLPWYIKVVVEPQELTKAQQKKVSGALGEESKIFTMHDISFINMLDGSTWHPEDAVKVKLPMVDIGEYESAIIVHITDDGKVELIEGSINGDTIEFAASSFSLYGIAGSMSSVDDLLAAQDTAAVWPWILAAAIALAAIIFIAVRRKNKNADSVTDFEDPEL